jgi:hypothetical protein
MLKMSKQLKVLQGAKNQMMEEVPPLNFPAKSLEEARISIPENLLPAAAQRRLWDARVEAERIKIWTEASIASRYRSEPNPGGASFSEYKTRGQAAIELDEMRTKISLNVLSAVIDEFRESGKSGKEIRQIMEDEIIVATHLYELTAIQQHLVWWELGLYTSAFLEWIDDGVESGTQSNSSVAANGENDQKRHEAIEKFLAKMRDAGLKVNKTDFWMVAGYEDATTFQRYNRYDPRTTATAVRKFEHVLAMKPEDFKAALEKERAK